MSAATSTTRSHIYQTDQLLLKDAVDLFDQYNRGVVLVAADIILVYLYLLHLRFHARLYV